MNETFSITFLYTFPSSHNNIAPTALIRQGRGAMGMFCYLCPLCQGTVPDVTQQKIGLMFSQSDFYC